MALNRVLAEQFIASHRKALSELVLDIDASDLPLHGKPDQSQFHGFYDPYCYLPLYVFCGQAMPSCLPRPGRIDGAKHAAAVIKLLVSRLRQAWPKVWIRRARRLRFLSSAFPQSLSNHVLHHR